MDEYDDWDVGDPTPTTDPREDEARAALRSFINDNPTEVFYSRQLAVMFEKKFLHWITYRALQDLLAEKVVQKEVRTLMHGYGAPPVLAHSESLLQEAGESNRCPG